LILLTTLVFVQPEANDSPAGDGQGDGADGNVGGAGRDNQAYATTTKAVAADAAAADAAETSHKTEIPHHSKV
jgi:hypothetical protein